MEINKENLLCEIKSALEDEFVANVTQKDNTLCLRFVNGQLFQLTVEPVI